jgi:Kef-type K+ transport system membrane component KefB
MSTVQTGSHASESLLFFVLVQLVLIIVAARLAGGLATRLAQSRVVGEIIVGILLGPSLLGRAAPDLFASIFQSNRPEPMMILSQIGLILLMFQIGSEFDFTHLADKPNRRAVLRIAAAGMLLPFLLGFLFGWTAAPILSPDAPVLAHALFTATALSITALPILGRIMMEFGMTKTPLGVITISAAAINDVVGWLLLTVVTAVAVTEFSAATLAARLAGLTGYVVVTWSIVRPILQGTIERSRARTRTLSPNLLGLMLACIFVSAIATYEIGIFAIFGGFMMGILVHDQRAFVESWNESVGRFVTVFFLPIFFTYTGLRTDIGGLNSPSLWAWCALLMALAVLGKFGGCYLAARWSKRSVAESKVIGIMMNTRALMELIVINVGFDLHVISQNVFTMLVLMAVLSTVITTPALRRWLPGTGIAIPRFRRTSD